MIISIDTTDSNIRIEHKHENVDMSLYEVFSLLVEPALLGLSYQKGSILDACEAYITENSEEFITQSRTKEYSGWEEADEEEDKGKKECKDKCSLYTSGYDKGYLVGLKDALLKAKGLEE